MRVINICMRVQQVIMAVHRCVEELDGDAVEGGVNVMISVANEVIVMPQQRARKCRPEAVLVRQEQHKRGQLRRGELQGKCWQSKSAAPP